MNSIHGIDISSITIGQPEVQGGQQASNAKQESCLDQETSQSEPNHPNTSPFNIAPFNNVQVVQTSGESSPNQSSVVSKLAPTIPTEKVVITKTTTRRVTERTVLATESRPQGRRDFNDSSEKRHPIGAIEFEWVKESGFGEKVENLEYRVYLDNAIVETKLNAQLEAAKAQQKDQESGRFTYPESQKFNDKFASQGSSKGEVELDVRRIRNEELDLEEYKITSKYETEGCNTGVAWSLGRRGGMEDSHIASTFEIKVGDDQFPVQITGVFDGHGGPKFSEYVKANIVKTLKHYLEAFNQGGLSDAGIMSALKIAMVALDGQKDAPGEEPHYDQQGDKYIVHPGTTANVAITIKDELWIANVGDSRALLLVECNTQQLSKDIKPVDVEKKVNERGGGVLYGRLMCTLSVGTAIGDNNYASVSSRPKVTRLTADQFKGHTLIQVCDGITDVASSNEIGQFASIYLRDGDSPAKVAGKLVAQAYAAQSGDNLTCMVTPLP